MSSSEIVILVVDDNPASRYSTSRVLRSAGWTVWEAETGEEGFTKALGDIDLLVLDVNLPDIDGFEVCRRLRGLEQTARLPILHLSATFVTPDHKVTGLDAGADGYLTHPIEPPVLIATVNAFLRTRQAELDLRRSEARFKAIFEHALSGVFLLDESFLCVDANPAICELLLFDRGQIVGHALREFVAPTNIAPFETMQRLLAEDLGWQGVLTLIRADGHPVSLEWHVSIHTDPALRLAIVNDISERLRYEEERESLLQSERAARSEAERANRLKDEFLATLSHELRTPLSAIVGWAQILTLGAVPEEDRRKGLEAIERNARAQAQMISDLLDVSRITAGKIRLDVQSLVPADVIEAALTTVLPTAAAKSIRITKSLDADAGTIMADASRLQQVIWNLVNNAVKFTQAHGHVHVVLQRIDSQIEIRVSDNGQGIQGEMLQSIFERFRQGDASSTREHGGLGLGLAIAKQLVELHGGTISAESEGSHRGATFRVLIPVQARQRDEEDEERSKLQSVVPQPRDAVDLSGLRILLVEDDPDSRTVLNRIMTSSGAEVRDASSVDLALDALMTFQPMVLVSDLGMPGRDGFELIREVRQRGYTSQKLPAVALTAFARSEDRRRALLAGFQVHLAKPVAPHELTATIASLSENLGN